MKTQTRKKPASAGTLLLAFISLQAILTYEEATDHG